MSPPVRISSAALLLSTTALTGHAALAATNCANLASLAPADTVITIAQTVTGGSFTPPGSSTALTGLPDFCRIAGSIRPTSDSDIKVEIRDGGPAVLTTSTAEFQILPSDFCRPLS